MRQGILLIDGKVTLGPVKYNEAEAAFKARIRSGEAGTVEVWSSDSSKRAKLKAESIASAEKGGKAKAEPANSKK